MLTLETLSSQFTALVDTISLSPTPQGIALGMALSFLGGVVSSLLPCTLTMLPMMLAIMGTQSPDIETSWRTALRKVALFVLGVSLTLAVLGVISGLLGWVFGAWLGPWMYGGVGLLLMLVGAVLAHLPGFRHLNASRFGLSRLPDWAVKSEGIGPMLLGIAMGLVASPCGTPYLAAILGLISYSRQWALGGVYLLSYALGQSMVLVIAGMGAGWLQKMLALRSLGEPLQRLSGWLFLMIGALLVAKGLF